MRNASNYEKSLKVWAGSSRHNSIVCDVAKMGHWWDRVNRHFFALLPLSEDSKVSSGERRVAETKVNGRQLMTIDVSVERREE